MDILLINPRHSNSPFLLPLGLGYIASVLREESYNVSILDIDGFGYSDEEVEEIIRMSEFDIVGIGGVSSTYKYVKWLAKILRKYKPQVPIIAGNLVSTAYPELLLKNSDVDIAVIDEGEITFKELISTINNGGSLKEINGIYYKDNGDIIRTPPRERIADLDSLPFPAWDLFPTEVYINNSAMTSTSLGLRGINISTARGCPYECIFCSHSFGKKIYTRSVKSVIDEIRELKRRYGIEFIFFCDVLFLIDKNRVLELCERIIAENLAIKWFAAARIDSVDYNLLRKMYKAGCVGLEYGFESGSQAILDSIKKHISVRQAEEVARITRLAGIKISGSFTFGMPGETLETIKETLEFIKRTHLKTAKFCYATPFPNTELYEIAKRMGRLPYDEDKYMERLGDINRSFSVNLTGFSDAELFRLKNLSESIVKRNLNFRLRLEEFITVWHRRYVIIRLSLKNSGIIPTLKMVFSKFLFKIGEGGIMKIKRLILVAIVFCLFFDRFTGRALAAVCKEGCAIEGIGFCLHREPCEPINEALLRAARVCREGGFESVRPITRLLFVDILTRALRLDREFPPDIAEKSDEERYVIEAQVLAKRDIRIFLNTKAKDPLTKEELTEVLKRVEIEVARTSNGRKGQNFELNNVGFVIYDIKLFVDEAKGWRLWSRKDNFNKSKQDSEEYVAKVDPCNNVTVYFGDGIKGKIPPQGSNIKVSFRIFGKEAELVTPCDVVELFTNPRIARAIKNSYNPSRPLTKANFVDLYIKTMNLGRMLPADINRLSTAELYRLQTELLSKRGITVFIGTEPDELLTRQELGAILYYMPVDELLGLSSGKPDQVFELKNAGFEIYDLHLFVNEGAGYEEWNRRVSFRESKASDRDYLVKIDADNYAKVHFGDNMKGKVPNIDSPIKIRYRLYAPLALITEDDILCVLVPPRPEAYEPPPPPPDFPEPHDGYDDPATHI